MTHPVKEDYHKWDKENLICRIRQLETDLRKAKAANNKAAYDAKNASNTTKDGAPAAATADTTSENIAEGDQQPPMKKRKKVKKFDATRYNTRYIALKFAYLGKNYGGLEYQPNDIPTIEGKLWNALVTARLIVPRGDDEKAVDFNDPGLEFSKCGRTDRGVSSFGQVIALRVRSSKPMPKPEPEPPAQGQGEESVPEGAVSEAQDVKMENATGATEAQATQKKKKKPQAPPKPTKPWDHITDELPYVRILNKLLPNDIRILAWCPTPPPGFSARYSCVERQYRYFFTQPAYGPPPLVHETIPDSVNPKPGWLDIEAMKEGAKRFIGSHDFRNFCKIDGSKQITEFTRAVFDVSITEVEDIASALPYLATPEFNAQALANSQAQQGDKGDAAAVTPVYPKVYSFNVNGNAFLWHQIRHMIGILFLIGQGFESPSVIDELLDVDKYPRRPTYEMAHDVPLVLWDCLFRSDLEWVYEPGLDKYEPGGMVDKMWQDWREKKMDEVLSNRLLDKMTRQQEEEQRQGLAKRGGEEVSLQDIKFKASSLNRHYKGNDTGRIQGQYHPVLTRPLTPSSLEVNDRWARRKGFNSSAEMWAAGNGNWRLALKQKKAEGAGEVDMVDDGNE